MATPKLRQLAVKNIRIDGDTQARVAISDEVVAEYAEGLRADEGKTNWPPIVVFKEFGPPPSGSCLAAGVLYWLADGFHRVLAAERAGIESLLAEVREGTRVDARWYALGANKTHGLRRSNADKRKAVELALQMHPEYSDEKIAEHVGVSRVHVLNIRHETAGQPVNGLQPDTPPQARIGADGKRYPVPPPRPVPPPLPPIPGETDGGTPAPGKFGPPPPPMQQEIPGLPPGRAVIRDEVGQEVPPELLPIWNRRQEIQDQLTAISRIRGQQRRYQDGEDPIIKETNMSSLMAKLDQAYADLETEKPYAVCPSCHGLIGCRLCAGRGVLSKFRWDTCVSREQKAIAAAAAGGEA